jgi:hypothetical protein
VPSAPRDMGATWRSLGTLCRERGWSRSRLIYEWQENGLRFRTIPPGHEHEIDMHDPEVERTLDVEASEVTLTVVPMMRGGVGTDLLTLGIEVMPPVDASPAPMTLPLAPQTTTPPKTVSNKDLRDCILAIKDDRPNDPPDEEALRTEVENRLGLTVARDRVRDARKKVAPEWVNPVGRPRK